jgi:hypothetical protein
MSCSVLFALRLAQRFVAVPRVSSGGHILCDICVVYCILCCSMTYTKYFLRAFIGAQAMFRRHSAAAADICRNLSGVFSRRLAVLLRHASVLASRGVFDSCRAPLLRARFAPLLCGEHFSSKSLSFALCVLLRVSSYLSILATYFFVRGNLHTQYPELVWGPA